MAATGLALAAVIVVATLLCVVAMARAWHRHAGRTFDVEVAR